MMTAATATTSPPRMGFARWAMICVPLVLGLGLASGLLSGSSADAPWFAALAKPSLYPPGAVFPIAWTVLYILMGLALAMVAAAPVGGARKAALTAFLVHFLLNLAWSPTFFGAQWIGAAFILLLALDAAALVTTMLFARVRTAAAWLLAPYLAWLGFATWLNGAIWALN